MHVSRPQHQGSLSEQLRALVKLANSNGLYDAADWLTQRLDVKPSEKPKTAR